ncbi:MAG TPA: DJ-1/PfpI family protein [Thermoanaerobaculia bacterium]|jgi:putative intracellular protease/amidase
MKRTVVRAACLLLAVASTALAVGPKDGGGGRNVAILIFPGVQIIDYTGPWEVLGHASVGGRPAFHVYTVSDSADPITTSMGMSVNPTYRFGQEPKPDLIVLPGGNVDPQLVNPALMRWVRERASSAELVLSVCNGAFFLAKAGLLDGLEATTFAGLIDELRLAAPKTRVVSDKRFVDNGRIITAAGLSSGIDGALHVIERLCGRGTAQVAAVSLEYDWRPDSGYARASLADKHLSPGFDAIREFPSRTVVRHEGTRDRWETSWRVQTDASAAAVLQKLDRAFEGAPGAVRLAVGSWRLPGDDGTTWSESTRVSPAEGKSTGYVVTMTVARSPK